MLLYFYRNQCFTLFLELKSLMKDVCLCVKYICTGAPYAPLTFFSFNYRFSQVHEFEKPNDETALSLMNSCSATVLEEFPDIIFAYGYSDEYRSHIHLAGFTLFTRTYIYISCTSSQLFSMSPVALYSRKHQGSTRDEPGIDSIFLVHFFGPEVSFTWRTFAQYYVVFFCLIGFISFYLIFFCFCFWLICSKILSLVASFFAAVYVTKWKEFFPQKKLQYAPSFYSKVVSCASAEVLQAYLSWRQQDCKTFWHFPRHTFILIYVLDINYTNWHELSVTNPNNFRFLVAGHINNQYDTCFWMLVKSGKTICETQEVLKVCLINAFLW